MPCCSCLAILAELVEEEENYCVAILGKDMTSPTSIRLNVISIILAVVITV